MIFLKFKNKLYFLFVWQMILSIHLSAQSTNPISGRVMDARTQEPLIGVSVYQKGTTNGTTTDVEGRFTLSAPADATLIFQYVGYTSQEMPAGSVFLTIALEPTEN